MIVKSIYLTFLCLGMSIIGTAQLTLSGARITLSDDVEVYSSDGVLVKNTASDTSLLYVQDDSELFTESDIENRGMIYNEGFITAFGYESTSDTSVFVNEGELSLFGDFDAEQGVYSGQGLSSVSFTGGGDHYVSSTDQNQFRLLVVEEGDVLLETNIVAQNVRFDQDKIIGDGYRLGVVNTITGYNTTSYVEGLLGRVVKSGDYDMPIGTKNLFRPARVLGVTDSTVVYMEVSRSTSDYESFGELSEVDEALVWKYWSDPTTYVSLTSPFKIAVAYDVSDFSEISSVTSTHRVAISDTLFNGYYSYGGVTGASISGGLTTLYSTGLVPASGLVSVGEVCSLNRFEVSALLEGPYDNSTGLMNVSLVSDLKSQFEYGGSSSVQMRDGFKVPINAVDLVEVILRDEGTLDNLDTAYAWLLSDGDTKDFETGLNSTLGYCDLASSDFYVQVEHRNHLPIMSASSFSKVGTVTEVDLKTASNVYGVGFSSQYNSVTFNDDVLMFAGDNMKSLANVVNAVDYYEVIEDLITLPSGYLLTDLNLSGDVEAGDNDLGLDNSSWLRKATVR